ncbi:MAG TPA: AAA family ATPase, partial [Naasia sp.]
MSITQPHQAFARITDHTAEYRGPGADAVDELHAATSDEIRTAVLRRTAWEAQRLGAPVEVLTTGSHGEHRMTVSPDGHVTGTAGMTSVTEATAATPDSIPSSSTDSPESLATVPGTSATTGPRAPARSSFVASATPTATSPTPITRLGIRMKPTAAQAQEAAAVRATSKHWGGCRSIAIVNGKGGVGKTMTAAMLAAVFARNGGGSVLAWDNNDTRGTLGWRTEASSHDA